MLQLIIQLIFINNVFNYFNDIKCEVLWLRLCELMNAIKKEKLRLMMRTIILRNSH